MDRNQKRVVLNTAMNLQALSYVSFSRRTLLYKLSHVNVR